MQAASNPVYKRVIMTRKLTGDYLMDDAKIHLWLLTRCQQIAISP